MTDIKHAWKTQPTEEHTMMSINDLNLRMKRLRARISRRNLALYAYAIFNILCIVAFLSSGKLPHQRLPSILMLIAHLFVAWQVWYRFTPRETPPHTSGQNALQFHRQELQRQHGAVEKAWLWYIAPFMPPFIWQLSIWFGRMDISTPGGMAGMRLFVMVVLGAVFFWGCVWLLFSRHATRLELEIERLNGLRTE